MSLECRLKDNTQRNTQRTFSSAASFGFSLILALTSATYLGCRKSPSSPSAPQPSPRSSAYSTEPGSSGNERVSSSSRHPGLPNDQKMLAVITAAEDLPLWDETDLEINQNKFPKVLYSHKFLLKPKFYDGEMPLEYIGTENMRSPGITASDPLQLRYAFKDFKTYFIYEKGFMLKGIVAVDGTDTLVAEAKVKYDLANKQGVMQEFHYSHGRLAFTCTSKFDDLGMKTEEEAAIGKKEKEYFFLVPRL